MTIDTEKQKKIVGNIAVIGYYKPGRYIMVYEKIRYGGK